MEIIKDHSNMFMQYPTGVYFKQNSEVLDELFKLFANDFKKKDLKKPHLYQLIYGVEVHLDLYYLHYLQIIFTKNLIILLTLKLIIVKKMAKNHMIIMFLLLVIMI